MLCQNSLINAAQCAWHIMYFRYVEVDVFGACGTNRCPSGDRTVCNKMLERNYFFYLSFENSVCSEYITEKFWNYAQHYIVPIVLKRSIYEGKVPPQSFIAIDDFASAQHLAQYLSHLMSRTDEYMKYFEWKRIYYLVSTEFDLRTFARHPSWCKLCEYASRRRKWSKPAHGNLRWDLGNLHFTRKFLFHETIPKFRSKFDKKICEKTKTPADSLTTTFSKWWNENDCEQNFAKKHL